MELRPQTGRCAAACLLAVTLSACGSGNRSGNPDPGNRILHALAGDPLLTSLPAGMRLVGPIQLNAARYEKPTFDAGGWSGPFIKQCLSSSEPLATLFGKFDRSARAAGWEAKQASAERIADNWQKPGLSPGKPEYLTLLQMPCSAAGANYTLTIAG